MEPPAEDVDVPSCLICFLPRSSEEVCLPCGHREWHHECIYGWLERQSSCPLCRAPTSSSPGSLESALLALDTPLPGLDCERVLPALRLLSLPEARLLEDQQQLETELDLLETELQELRETEEEMELELQELSSDFHDETSPRDEAWALLDRFAAAAFRTNVGAEELFLALSPHGAPLALEAARPLFAAFGGASELGVEVACQRLDVNQSGWIEEGDLVEVMCRHAPVALADFGEG
ncbi:unnamed protein product [Symbiodinium sp. CCMP2592]|nr:unnamed protein product [Symbiodinium sp. CCMP2592]